MANFVPHGLIKTQMQQQLYNRAHIANVFTGMANPKEHETVALMEVVLYKNIFTDDNFAVTSEQPPSLSSRRRCDLVIKYLESGSFEIRALCFGECKRTDTSQEFSLIRLEKQARDYCKLYLEAEKEMPFVYAATMAGAHIRLWRCEPEEDAWTPFWGSSYEGDWAEYKDIGEDEAGQQLEGFFDQMKYFPPTPHAGQTTSSYISSHQPSTSSSSGPNIYNPPASGARVPGSYAVSFADQSSYLAPQTPSNNPASEAPLSAGYTVSYTSPSNYLTSQTVDNNPVTISSLSHYADAVGTSSSSTTQNQQFVSSEQGGTYDPTLQDPTDSNNDGEYMSVNVTKVPRALHADEFTFSDQRGHKRTTIRSDWTRTKYNGRTAWVYHGRKTSYVTYTKIA